MKMCDLCTTDVKKQFTGGEAKQTPESNASNVSICDELKDARSRLRPVKPPCVSPSKTTVTGVQQKPQHDGIQERKNYTHAVNITPTEIIGYQGVQKVTLLSTNASIL